MLIVDRGYDNNHIQSMITQRGAAPAMPRKINHKKATPIDVMTDAVRDRVEFRFNKLKCARRLAARNDRTAASRLGFIQFAAARL